ncbi:MmcQ/YjbR family DNA-binding protein [Saccharomonospora sp. NB11]|jgi:predicted DNA-binding protein (MmcQ/YjbR family)|uniref:MmcQ/YjbR family DNA-binding protein n=1 Tax=Saccharomonospora sp. NB11 TaxID=1642298 RepID=UPI0018D0EE11|nr:MmcQ/YjbR family DNA-binding protein [Saccharomonospora sp. NB11]
MDVWTPDRLRRLCLSFPAAVERFPFSPEISVFSVAGKMFAVSRLDEQPLAVSLKCAPEEALHLRDTYPAVAPGYHLNKRHWITVTLDGSLPDGLTVDLVHESYDLVVAGLPKHRQPRLDDPSAQ